MEHDTSATDSGEGGEAAAGAAAYSIWIEAEEWGEGAWDPSDEASDVVVTFGAARNRESGENLAGRYLWASDLILVDAVTRDSVEAVVADLLRDGGFESAFSEYAE